MGDFLPRFPDLRLVELELRAYFYAAPSRFELIAIESKCSIDGVADGWIRASVEHSSAVPPREDGNPFWSVYFAIRRGPFPYERGHYAERDLASFSELIEKFAGHTCSLFLEGEYLVPLADLPRRGVILSLLDLSVKASDAELGLSGAKFSVSDNYFDEVRWELNDEGDAVEATLVAYLKDGAIDETHLQSLGETMQDGFELLILETSEKKTHDEHRRKTTKAAEA